MKQQIISWALIMIMISNVTKVFGADFEVDGIYYDVISFDEMTVGVTHKTGIIGDAYKGEVVIPETVVYNNRSFRVMKILSSAFENCRELTSVSLPNSITEIQSNAFSRNSALVNVNLPTGLTYIGSSAFSGCSVESFSFPEGLTTIGSGAFSGCSYIKSIHLPNSLEVLDENAFKNCINLEEFNIPSKITILKRGVFSGCKEISSITIPKQVVTLESDAFYQCYKCNKIVFEDSDTPLYIIYDTYGHFSSGQYCKFLYLGRTFTWTNSYVTPFEELEEIVIGEKVSTIDEINLKTLNKVTIKSSVPPTLGKYMSFSNSQYMDMLLYVPDGSKDIYESVEPWKNFWNIKEYKSDGAEIEKQKCTKPTISYINGKLSFTSETEGATYESIITDTDIRSYGSSEVQLSITYNISVYATKSGYENSDVATATLCWIDVDPKTEGINNSIAQIRANAVLIKAEDSQITITGTDDGTKIYAYEINGMQIGSAVSYNGHANLTTNLKPGSIAIIKIGDKSMKVVVK